MTPDVCHPQYKISTAFASSHIPILRGDQAEAKVFWVNRPVPVTIIEFDFSDPGRPLVGAIEDDGTEVLWLEPDELTFRGRNGV